MPDTPLATHAPIQRPREQGFAHARRALRTLTRTHGFEPLALEGELPPGLRGTLVRNGPGAFECHGERYGHWFDGDGAITAVILAEGQARGAVRFVETPDRAAEQAAGRRLFTNFGSRPPTWAALLRSVVSGEVKRSANTNIIAWQDRLFALHEGSLPLELEAETLASLEFRDLGVLRSCMSAHPHRVAARRCTYNFGFELGLRATLELYALPDAGQARRLGSLALPHATMVHDFIATERHLVFLIAPAVLHLAPLLLRRRAFVEGLRWEPERGGQLIVVPIDEPDRVRRIAIDPLFVFHFANAFEDGPGQLVVDLVSYPDFPAINDWLTELISPAPMRTAVDGTLTRARVELGAGRVRFEHLLESVEFPRLDPRVEGQRHRFLYLAAHAQRRGVRPGLQDHLVKFDCESGDTSVWTFGPETYVSEPVFVPDPARAEAEDGGWLLSHVYDGERDRSCLAVVDAASPRRGVLARAWFDHHITPTFHGNWIANTGG